MLDRVRVAVCPEIHTQHIKVSRDKPQYEWTLNQMVHTVTAKL